MTMRIELVGGPFDGLQLEREDNREPENGFLILSRCPRHGDNSGCVCDDEMWYGYYKEKGKGAGSYRVLERQ